MYSPALNTFEQVMDFIGDWICCNTVDEDVVIDNMVMVRTNPDCMAVENVGYTHDPIVSHITGRAGRLAVLDNNPECTKDVTDVVVKHQPTPCEGSASGDEGVKTSAGKSQKKSKKSPGKSREVSSSQEDSSADKTVVANAPDTLIDAIVGTVLEGIVTAVVDNGVVDMATATAVEIMEADSVVNSGVGKASSVYRVCQDVVETKAHRRLPHEKRGDYVGSMVSEIKNRLGCPKPTEANKLAVRRMALNNITQHGLRPTHVRTALELIVAGVFVPDEYDLEAAKMLASNVQHSLTSQLCDAKPKSAWSRLFAPLTRGRAQARLRERE